MIGTTFFTQLQVRFPRFDDLNFHRTWARTYENCTPSHKSGTMPEAPPAKEGSTSSLPLIVPFRTTVPTREPVLTANSMRMRAATCLVGRGLDEETRGQEADVASGASAPLALMSSLTASVMCVFSLYVVAEARYYANRCHPPKRSAGSSSVPGVRSSFLPNADI